MTEKRKTIHFFFFPISSFCLIDGDISSLQSTNNFFFKEENSNFYYLLNSEIFSWFKHKFFAGKLQEKNWKGWQKKALKRLKKLIGAAKK